MADDPADPLAAMPWRTRRTLVRQLRRAWREGLDALSAELLVRLRTELAGVAVVAADSHGALSDVVWADGTVARLWLCHRPAIRSLSAAARDGDVVLVRADHHGHFWALYFATLEGSLPVLCQDLRVRAGDGGRGIHSQVNAGGGGPGRDLATPAAGPRSSLTVSPI